MWASVGLGLTHFCKVALLLGLPLNGGLVCLHLSQNSPWGDLVPLLLLPRRNVSLQPSQAVILMASIPAVDALQESCM